jgi:hypothetical protein
LMWGHLLKTCSDLNDLLSRTLTGSDFGEWRNCPLYLNDWYKSYIRMTFQSVHHPWHILSFHGSMSPTPFTQATHKIPKKSTCFRAIGIRRHPVSGPWKGVICSGNKFVVYGTWKIAGQG